MRLDKRGAHEIRPVKITPDFQHNPLGSVLIECGNTRVICSATVVDEIPSWMRSQQVKGGWITAEYQLLPTSTSERVRRERKGVGGRTQEIQRLIGRSLRASCDLEKLGSRSIYIDCDVLDADGGTRCASITGAMVALNIAINKLLKNGTLKESPIQYKIAAISVGVLNNEAIIDLNYREDSTAEVDMNVVMTEKGEFVELQGTAEGKPFNRKLTDEMINLAESGIKQLFAIQNDLLGE